MANLATINNNILADSGIDPLSLIVGTGTVNYVPKFTAEDTVANSQIFDNGTNVGIGTTSPTQKLTIAGDVQIGIPASVGALRFIGATDKFNFIIGKQINVNNAFEITPSTAVGGTTFSTPAFLVTSSGNVGIGTTSPSQALDVFGIVNIGRNQNSNVTNLNINSGSTPVSAFQISTDQPNLVAYLNSRNSYALGFYTNDAEQMRITSGGNVGIGTATPLVKLHVINTAGVAAYFTSSNNSVPVSLFNNGSALATIGFKGTTTSSEFNVRVGADANDFVAYTSNTERMRITSGGNVGIGTSSPGYKLEVVGNIQATGSQGLFRVRTDVDGRVDILGQNGYAAFIYFGEVGAADRGVLGYATGSGDLVYRSGANAISNGTERLRVKSTGAVQFNAYGSGSFTGTRAYDLSVDASGNIIEVPVGAGTITGSGTTNYIPKFTSSSAIGNSIVQDYGDNVWVGTNTAGYGTLNIQRFTSAPYATLTLTDQATPSNPIGLYLRSNGSSPVGISSAGAPIAFYTGGPATNEGMRLDASGNLLVGLSSALANGKLQVAGSIGLSGNTQIRQATNSDGNTLQVFATQFVAGNLNSYSYGYSGGGLLASVSAGDSILLFDAGRTTSTEGRVKITNTTLGNVSFSVEKNGVTTLFASTLGNVGIGSANPQVKLDVQSGSIGAYHNTASSGGAQLYLGDMNFAGGAYATSAPGVGAVYGPTHLVAGDLAFYVYNGVASSRSEAMRIIRHSSGNNYVGIGTTTPTTKLHVLSSDNTYANLVIAATSNNGNVTGGLTFGGLYNSDALNFYTGASSTTKMYISNAGNVGIGTTSPQAKLDVIGVGVFGTMTSSRSTYSNGLSLQNNTGEATSLFLWQSGVASAHIGSPANSTSLHIVNSYNTGLITDPNSIVLTSTGKVGIGTTSPAYKLEVSLPTTTSDIVQRWTSPSYDSVDLYIGSSQAYFGTLSTTPLAFRTANTERMRITAGGNVGIGTSAPATDFQVVRSGSVTGRFSNTATSVNTEIGVSGGLGYVGTQSANAFGIITSDTERVRITAGGSVGIGTSSPQAKLQVTNSTSDGIIVSTTANVEPFLAFWRNSASNGVGVLRLIDGGNLYFDNGATGAAQSTKMQLAATGAVRINSYGAGSFTGTVAYNLAVDASGNIIETAGGVVDGSGTTNYISKWSDPNTLTNSIIYDNGSTVSIGLGSTTPSYTNAYGYPQFAVESNLFASSHVFTHNSTDGNYSFFALGKSKGTAAAPTIVENSETIGDIQFWAYDGTAYRNTAFIRNQIDGTPGAGDTPGRLVFATTNDGSSAATEKMRITNGGNVGIGTTSPTFKLEVNGSFSASTSGVQLEYNSGILYHGSSYYQFPSGSYYYIYGRAGMGLIFGSNNGEAARIDVSSRNFLIGTTTDNGYKLNVAGNIFSTTTTWEGGIVTNSNGASYSSFGWYQGGTKRWSFYNDDNSSNLLALANQSGTVSMTFLQNGNVGIGTTSPQDKLTVKGATNYNLNIGLLGSKSGIYVYNDASSAYNDLRIDASLLLLNSYSGANVLVGTTTDYGTYKLQVNGNGRVGTNTGSSFNITTNQAAGSIGTPFYTDLNFLGYADFVQARIRSWDESASTGYGYLTFWTNTGSGATEKMRITSGGEVVVNGTTPIYTAADRGNITLSGSSGILSFRINSANSGYLYHTGTNMELWNAAANGSLLFSTSNTERMRVTSGGNVGIGTTTPSAKLTLYGTTNDTYILNFSRVFGQVGSLYTDGGGAGITQGALDEAGIYLIQNSRIDFRVNGSERMRITSAGNVGIGTTSPTGYTGANLVLHLNTSSTITDLKLTNGTTGTAALAGGLLRQDGRSMYLWNVENNFLSFGTNNSEQMRIASTGNLLLGTTTDSGIKLDVVGSGRFTGDIVARNSTYGYIALSSGTSGNSGYVNFYSSSGNRQGYIGYSSTNNSTDAGTIPYVAGTHDFIGAIQTNSSIKTAAPSGGTAATWKLGSRISNTCGLPDTYANFASQFMNTNKVIEVEIGGVTVYIPTVTPGWC